MPPCGSPHLEHPSHAFTQSAKKQHLKQHAPMHGVPILVPSGATTIKEVEKVPLWEASF